MTALMGNFYWPTIILLVTLALVVLEIMIPSGGILGVLAAISLLVAIGAGYAHGGFHAGTLFLLAAVMILPIVLYLMVHMWPKTPMGKRIIMHPPSEDTVLPANRLLPAEWIGRKGVSLVALLPAGAVRIDERILDAITEGVIIEKDSPIVVVAVRDNRLVVRFDERPDSEAKELSHRLASQRDFAENLGPATSTTSPRVAPSVSDFSGSMPASESYPPSKVRPDVDLDVPDPFDDSLP